MIHFTDYLKNNHIIFYQINFIRTLLLQFKIVKKLSRNWYAYFIKQNRKQKQLLINNID